MKITGLYAVTPEWNDTDRLADAVEAALRGGAAAVQYRHKDAAAPLALEQARRLLALCQAYRRPLIINDSVDLMLACDADGVHLGRDDADPFQVRERLGPDRIIGVSCYDDFDRALALRGIADYLAFGSVFLSQVKPGAVRAPLSLFQRGAAVGLPMVAIGGIDATNADQVIAAGAQALAVISGVFAAADPQQAAAAIAARFDQRHSAGR